jgi:hypothetical protein
MNRAFIAEYFDYAKKHGNDPALGFLQDKKINWIPHWLIRSKAKHFALGLMELNAPDQGYFYLFPHHHAEWIYTLLAAQSLGLTTVALPPDLSLPTLKNLLENFPPCFVYGGSIPSEAHWNLLKIEKKILSFIFGGANPSTPEDRISSFRKIHNRGVMVESKFFQSYRQHRESLTEKQVISPLEVDANHRIVERELRSGALLEKIQTLENRLKGKKTPQIFAEVDLSMTSDQILGLYWPLMTGKRVLLSSESVHWMDLHPGYGPNLALLSPDTVSNLAGQLPLGKAPLLKHSVSFWAKRRARKKLGGNLQEIWSQGPLGEETHSFFKKLGIRLWTVEI